MESIHHVPSSGGGGGGGGDDDDGGGGGGDGVLVFEGANLPAPPVEMRLGWSQTTDFSELDFDRPNQPVGGSATGTSYGVTAPPFPPGLVADTNLFFGFWLAGDPDIVEFRQTTGGITEWVDIGLVVLADKTALMVEWHRRTLLGHHGPAVSD